MDHQCTIAMTCAALCTHHFTNGMFFSPVHGPRARTKPYQRLLRRADFKLSDQVAVQQSHHSVPLRQPVAAAIIAVVPTAVAEATNMAAATATVAAVEEETVFTAITATMARAAEPEAEAVEDVVVVVVEEVEDAAAGDTATTPATIAAEAPELTATDAPANPPLEAPTIISNTKAARNVSSSRTHNC